MGFWKELKEEWSWTNIKKSWTDFVAIIFAVTVAEQFREYGGFWLYMLVWLIVFFLSRFIILFIKRSIS